MTPTLNDFVDWITRDKTYATESDVTTSDLVTAINRTQDELAEALCAADETLYTYTWTPTVSSSGTVLIPNMRKIQFVERQGDSNSGWCKVKQASFRSREGINDSDATPSSGTVRVYYSRLLPALSYGTASSATDTTLVLASSPTYGTTSLDDDYYNGASVYIDSATTGANQTAVITDYAGSTRTATLTWPSGTTPTGTIKYAVVCEIPRPYAWDGIINGTLMRLTRDDRATQEYGRVLQRVESVSRRMAQSMPTVTPYEYGSGPEHFWYLRGDRFFIYEGYA